MSVRDETITDKDLPMLDLPSKVREYYNILRDRILLSMNSESDPPRLIGITSCYSGEGVSTVAANLAVSLSHLGNVLLVDANLDRPLVNKIFRKDISPGLAESIEEGRAITHATAQNLDVVCAGQTNGRLPSKYESSERLSEILEAYRKDYTYVLFDLPAANDNSAAIRLASLVDGVVMVVEAERTRLECVRHLKEQLEQVRANILGVVLNKRRFPIPRFLYRR